jgi:aryl-alcohol dehydrogenase-like predicted oxidoreductase
MKNPTIPGTDLQPYPICLGCGPLGSAVDEPAAFRLLDAFVDHGGNFVDSAKIYADWIPGIERSISEKTIGRWLQARRNRSRVIVATKGAHPELVSMHVGRLSPQEIRSDLDASLSHLQVDTIDLYWLHRDDTARPVEEILETLNQAVSAGKIRYYGCSNWQAARIQAAQAYSAAHSLPGFCGDQMMWSLAAVDTTRVGDPTLAIMNPDLWELHRASGLAAIPYSSQANGFFQKMENGRLSSSAQQTGMYGLPENGLRYARARQLAAELTLTTSQVVLAYLLSQPFLTIPIVGCRTVEQLEDSLQAAETRLTESQVNFLQGKDSGRSN